MGEEWRMKTITPWAWLGLICILTVPAVLAGMVGSLCLTAILYLSETMSAENLAG